RKVEGSADGAEPAHGLSYTLLTGAGGQKVGKSDARTVRIWLDPERTSPFAFYQYWLDSSDDEVGRRLRTFTLFDRESVERLEVLQSERPEERAAQRALALDVTTRVHGAEAAHRAIADSRARFGSTGPTNQNPDLHIDAGALSSAVDLAVRVGAATSRSAARRLIEQGGFYVDERRVDEPESAIKAHSGEVPKIRIGKERLLLGA